MSTELGVDVTDEEVEPDLVDDAEEHPAESGETGVGGDESALIVEEEPADEGKEMGVRGDESALVVEEEPPAEDAAAAGVVPLPVTCRTDCLEMHPHAACLFHGPALG